jgi:pilus assembly protein CpaB
MNRVQIGVLGVTVLAFAGAAYMFATTTPVTVVQNAPVAKMETDDVLVAAHEIPMGHLMSEPDIHWQAWPRASMSPDMIKRSDGPQGEDFVRGAIARSSFLSGEPMRRDKLVKGPNSGFLSAVLPSGMRAVAIQIEEKGGTSAGGFILPNDRVDVIRVYRDEEQTKARGVEVDGAQTILTNVRVLAIGQDVHEKDGQTDIVGTANATLELDPKQAELIVLAQRLGGGHLHLTLRSMLDSGGKTDSVADLGGGKGGGMTIVRFGAPTQAVR